MCYNWGMAEGSFHKSQNSKFFSFLFISPLSLGIRPLFVNYSPLDTVVFLGGLLLILGLVIYNNTIPYITFDDISLKVLLAYREEREEHRFDGILGYKLSGRRRVTLYSLDHKPLKLILTPGDRVKFIQLLDDKNIQPQGNKT